MKKQKKGTKDQALYLRPDALRVGWRGCCPRCGEGRLFSGILKPAAKCMNCDLDFAFIDSGDGPAVFVIMIVGFIVTGLAMAVQSVFSPPFWVHFILWVPVITILSLWSLQFSKGIMIAMQYRTRAREGRRI